MRIYNPALAKNDLVSRVDAMARGAESVGPMVRQVMGSPSTRYEAPVGAVPHINATRLYQQEGRGHMAGYLNNPLEEAGRQAIAQQLMAAPLGGHVRHALQGQTLPLMDRPVTNMEARIAEQALAGVLATGVGGWGLLSAIDALNGGDPDPQAVYIG